MRRVKYKNKKGTYIHRIWRRKGGDPLALVMFDGNKRPSRVPYEDLETIKESTYKGRPDQGKLYWQTED